MRHATTRRPMHRFAVAVIAAISAIAATTACARQSVPRDAQATATSEAARRPPNVLFILADDMRPDAIGALADDGGSGASTEHLDALVARGTAFTNTVHMGGEHGAICITSRAMILTGRNLWTHGDNQLPDQPLWPEAFAAAGYATFGCGKWHNGEASFARAFEFEGPHAGGFLPSTREDGDGYDRPPADGRPDTWSPSDESRRGHWMAADDGVVHSSERWADATIAFLEAHRARNDGRPFLAQLAFHAPHDPRQAPAPYLDKRPLASIALPPSAMPAHPFDQGDARVRDERLAPFPRSDDALRTHEREYRAIVEHMDDQIGRVLDALERLGLADDTIVVFTGDHGLAVSRHGLLGKQNLYEHSVRTPLVVAGPGVAQGRRVPAPVYLHSVLATAAELAGVPAMPSVAPEAAGVGRLARADRAPAASDAPFGSIYAAYRSDLQRMVRDDRWKLVVYPKARVVQLFDLERDPWELENLAGDPAHRGTVARLRRELLGWMARVDDPLSPEALAGLEAIEPSGRPEGAGAQASAGAWSTPTFVRWSD